MNRHLMFALLLATGVLLAEHGASAAPAQANTQAAQKRTELAHAKGKQDQARAKKADAKTDAAQKQPESAQTKTDKELTAKAEPTSEAPARTESAQASSEEAAAPTNGETKTEGDSKLQSVPGGKALGMSILGNQEAPKSLVIVPWKSSEPGRSPGLSPMLDDSRQPVDKDVFMRALRYYEIRSTKKP